MAKSDLLNFLKDINFMYNDCGMHDCVSKMLEDFEAEIRAKAIDEFAEKLSTDVESFVATVNGVEADLLTLDYFDEFIFDMAEQLKEE